MKKDITNIAGITVFVLLALSLLIVTIDVAMERNEKMACTKLLKQEMIYRDFFYSDWQTEMCRDYNILAE